MVASADASLRNDRVTSCEEGVCQVVPGQRPCLVACHASDLEKVDVIHLVAFRVIQMAFQCHLRQNDNQNCELAQTVTQMQEAAATSTQNTVHRNNNEIITLSLFKTP